ncbi:hypothetical protein [Streptomyces sp. B15]|uniref:hypothetical protein n=1 Tax=Streptomyces sp. B15 TaxID=1537797 RepID=UPI0027DE8B8D|nr:hypothetical protein [Streptomyces sp. B15]
MCRPLHPRLRRRSRHPRLSGLAVGSAALRLTLLRVAVTGLRLLRLALLGVAVPRLLLRLLRLARSATVRAGLARLLRLLTVRPRLTVRAWLVVTHGGAFPSVDVLNALAHLDGCTTRAPHRAPNRGRLGT